MAVNLAKFSLIDGTYERYFHVADINVPANGDKTVAHSAGEFIPIVLFSTDGENWSEQYDLSNEIPVWAFITTSEIQVGSFSEEDATVRILGIKP